MGKGAGSIADFYEEEGLDPSSPGQLDDWLGGHCDDDADESRRAPSRRPVKERLGHRSPYARSPNARPIRKPVHERLSTRPSSDNQRSETRDRYERDHYPTDATHHPNPPGAVGDRPAPYIAPWAVEKQWVPPGGEYRQNTWVREPPACRFWGTATGCRHGSTCRFKHSDQPVIAPTTTGSSVEGF